MTDISEQYTLLSSFRNKIKKYVYGITIHSSLTESQVSLIHGNINIIVLYFQMNDIEVACVKISETHVTNPHIDKIAYGIDVLYAEVGAAQSIL